jgi:LPPG:FO 2-phospho-L-lactate transferase
MGFHVLALAGGVGGAKLVLGLARVLPPERLTVVVNTGDDDVFHGLNVSPDLDTVMYTVAGLSNPETGWGFQGETFEALGALGRLGAETWFGLGDKDLATHIRRTDLLRGGASLSGVTAELCRRLGVQHVVAPMTDASVRTIIETELGAMAFQEYFVKHRCEPSVKSLTYEGSQDAGPSPALEAALESADAVVVCPSNPFLSVAPILSLRGVRERLGRGRRPVAIVTPIIGGKAIKGPADRLIQQLYGEEASSLAVARYYQGLATHFVLDQQDAHEAGDIASLGYGVSVQQTLMRSDDDKVGLARAVCEYLAIDL